VQPRALVCATPAVHRIPTRFEAPACIAASGRPVPCPHGRVAHPYACAHSPLRARGSADAAAPPHADETLTRRVRCMLRDALSTNRGDVAAGARTRHARATPTRHARGTHAVRTRYARGMHAPHTRHTRATPVRHARRTHAPHACRTHVARTRHARGTHAARTPHARGIKPAKALRAFVGLMPRLSAPEPRGDGLPTPPAGIRAGVAEKPNTDVEASVWYFRYRPRRRWHPTRRPPARPRLSAQRRTARSRAAAPCEASPIGWIGDSGTPDDAHIPT
jgi:hypothetical protein